MEQQTGVLPVTRGSLYPVCGRPQDWLLPQCSQNLLDTPTLGFLGDRPAWTDLHNVVGERGIGHLGLPKSSDVEGCYFQGQGHLQQASQGEQCPHQPGASHRGTGGMFTCESGNKTVPPPPRVQPGGAGGAQSGVNPVSVGYAEQARLSTTLSPVSREPDS